MNNVIVTLTGPSCSGKTTLTRHLMASEQFTEIISHTTRDKRIGEVQGAAYFFVTPDEFKDIEMLERIDFNGNQYGGSVQEFTRGFSSGLIPAIIVEPNGMRQINMNAQKKGWIVINVWVGCPTELQAERFIYRFSEELRTVFGSDKALDHGKLMREYVNRMISMQKVENEWKDMFWSDMAEHHILLDYFDKDNEHEAIGSIIAEAHRVQK